MRQFTVWPLCSSCLWRSFRRVSSQTPVLNCTINNSTLACPISLLITQNCDVLLCYYIRDLMNGCERRTQANQMVFLSFDIKSHNKLIFFYNIYSTAWQIHNVFTRELSRNGWNRFELSTAAREAEVALENYSWHCLSATRLIVSSLGLPKTTERCGCDTTSALGTVRNMVEFCDIR